MTGTRRKSFIAITFQVTLAVLALTMISPVALSDVINVSGSINASALVEYAPGQYETDYPAGVDLSYALSADIDARVTRYFGAGSFGSALQTSASAHASFTGLSELSDHTSFTLIASSSSSQRHEGTGFRPVADSHSSVIYFFTLTDPALATIDFLSFGNSGDTAAAFHAPSGDFNFCAICGGASQSLYLPSGDYWTSIATRNTLSGTGFATAQLTVTFTPVPLPAAVWLLISSLFGLGFFRKKIS